MRFFGKSKDIARRFDAGEQLEEGEVLDVTLTENGVNCVAVVDEKDYWKWVKKHSKVDVTKTENGVVCEAWIGE